MSLAQISILLLLYFLFFTFFNGVTFTSTGIFLNSSCSPAYYVAVHSCHCSDNRSLDPDVVSRPLLRTYSHWNLKLWNLVLYFGRGNAITTGVIVVITLLNVIVYKLRQLQEGSLGQKSNSSVVLSAEKLCRRFSLAEIELATCSFDEAFLIGKGGFGKVYKGIIDHGETTTVAIKRLDSRSKQGASEFWTEINTLSRLRHCHLVSLIGYCDEFQEMILVYEYVPSGNLSDRLHRVGRSDGKAPLSWIQRLKICIGAARALDYLHTGTCIKNRVIHRDIKSSNILLDDNSEAKVSDLGVAKICATDQPYTHVNTEVKGSFGYFDPHYFMTRKLTRKSDVYAFGVVLFEVLSGRPAVDLTLEEDQQSLSRWAQHCITKGTSGQIIERNLMGQIAPDCLMTFLQIADQCLENLPSKRPTMTEVVVKLESALALQDRSDRDAITKCDDTSSGKFSMTSGRVTFSRALRHFFSVKIRLSSVPGGAMKKKNNDKSNLESGALLPNKDGGDIKEVPLSGQPAALNLKVFTFSELESSTMNFSKLLGKGGFGSVFMGWVDAKTYIPSKVDVGMPVAVKKLDKNGFQGHSEWQMEVNTLGRFRHSNIVKLLGYCQESTELLLVFEYMPKGSLENYMFRSKEGSIDPLPWSTLLKIMIGAARGLAFMHHREIQVIYRDFKSDNILLDQDFNAKLADFGLAKFGDGETHVSTCVMGTWGYAAPEYIATGHLSVKSDVYSYGIVLLEILTGFRVIDKNRSKEEQSLVDWARPLLLKKRKLKNIMDPRLIHDCPPEGAFKYAALVHKCLHSDPRKRPSMEEAMKNLEEISAIKLKQIDYSIAKVHAY